MNELIQYSNGLKLIVSGNTAVRSVAMGIWVGAGSSKENADNNGISHFTEHVMFKGTDKYSAYDIASLFEGMGAMVNAFTGKEATCYYVKSIDEYAERCFAALTHILTHSAFNEDELNKERKVIVEEINMVEDSPEDICYDLLAETLYKDAALGRTILGPVSNVNSFTGKNVVEYMDEYYTADNIVVSVSGNVTAEWADRLVRKYLLGEIRQNNSVKNPLRRITSSSGFKSRIKDFEQSNIGISYPTVEFNHKLSPVQSVFSIIFGGGMSSRLFQKIREQMGLAYSVYSTPLAYTGNGNFNVLLNITAANTCKAVTAVKNEIISAINGGVTCEEVERAKIQLKSALVFSEENVQNIMSAQGKLMLLCGETYSVDKRIAEIDAVTKNDVDEFIRRFFISDGVCAAYVGREYDVDIFGIIKS